ncbi:hypothetical protein DQ04_19251020 [Trypanosoma grayi]|uniref:hypothetical protein n=1 Tax=Trypanosoma grayi TaxID=71804 RepID=UPI0004F49009|nr:hypothetical protein DQ04_19251020 [Trypanosoma grayi]KEG05694.1 hypothetical protein DQ04_19251020 [Trypanosoma grayi]
MGGFLTVCSHTACALSPVEAIVLHCEESFCPRGGPCHSFLVLCWSFGGDVLEMTATGGVPCAVGVFPLRRHKGACQEASGSNGEADIGGGWSFTGGLLALSLPRFCPMRPIMLFLKS